MFKLRFLVFSCSSPQIPNNTSCFPLNSCVVFLRWFYFQNLTKKPISKLVVINLVGYSINIVKVSSGPENSTSPVNLTTGFDARWVEILTSVMHFSCFYHTPLLAWQIEIWIVFVLCSLKLWYYRLEKEHSSVRKQLTNEVENKKTTIGSLSKELEVHQKNFIELKDELSKVICVLSIIIYTESKVV